MDDSNGMIKQKEKSKFFYFRQYQWYRIKSLFTKSNYMKHFERELKILQDSLKPEDGNLLINPYIKDIKRIIRKFGREGHSGGSAPYGAGALSRTIKDTLLFMPLSPITGEDSEWMDVKEAMGGKPYYQNNRLGSVFKDGKDGKPHYNEAVIFRGKNDVCFTGGDVALADGRTIGSSQFIKLPFIPKSFYIDVIETEWADKDEKVKKEGGGWWTSVVKDESQLKEVEEYYDVVYKEAE
jgi:hypothetical protein